MRQAGGEALGSLLEHPEFEIFPSAGVEERAARLPRGAKIAITCSPSKGIDATLALADRLSHREFSVLPHISARLVSDRAHLERIIYRLDELGITDIFVIGGDAKQPVGPFSSALSLMTALTDVGHGFSDVGVAAYPEGHPIIDEGTLWEQLQAKQSIASYMITQVCFDPVAIVTWIDEARRRKIRLPVRIGVAGAVNRNKLLKTSLRIGVGDSARFARKHVGLVAKMVGPGRYSPSDLVAPLAGLVDDDHYDVRGLHLYTFNEVDSTERWRRSLLASVTE